MLLFNKLLKVFIWVILASLNRRTDRYSPPSLPSSHHASWPLSWGFRHTFSVQSYVRYVPVDSFPLLFLAMCSQQFLHMLGLNLCMKINYYLLNLYTHHLQFGVTLSDLQYNKTDIIDIIETFYLISACNSIWRICIWSVHELQFWFILLFVLLNLFL